MSVRALTWAWDRECGNAQQKLVLLALADRADEDGVCWPSRKWLTRKTGMQLDAVKRALKALEKDGLFRRERLRHEDGRLAQWRFQLGVPADVDDEPTMVHSSTVEPRCTGAPTIDSQEEHVSPDGETADHGALVPHGRDFVAFFVDEVKRVTGSDPIRISLARVGRESKRLLAEGVDANTISAAITVVAERGLSVGAIPGVAEALTRQTTPSQRLAGGLTAAAIAALALEST